MMAMVTLRTLLSGLYILNLHYFQIIELKNQRQKRKIVKWLALFKSPARDLRLLSVPINR